MQYQMSQSKHLLNIYLNYNLLNMKTAKVKEIWKFRKWEWPHGDVFYIPLTLDNWETITLWKKKEDAFKVGDTVNYEVVEEGKKWKEVKENPFKPKADYSNSSKGAVVGMALKIAFECCYDKKAENFNETIALAQRIVDVAEEMMWEKAESKLEESADNDSTPF